MKNFNDRNSGKRNFSKNNDRDRRFESKREGRPEMFKAICADCGKPCEIPFKPNNSRPVFCSACFSEHSGEGSERSDFKRKEMFEAKCDKCGKRCEVPFKPVSGKPVFCSQCFDRDNGGRDNRDSRDSRDNHNHNSEAARVEQYKEQFEKLNAKLDLLLASLRPKAEKMFVEVKKEEDKIKTVLKNAKAIEKKIIEPKIKEIKKAVVKKLNSKKKK